MTERNFTIADQAATNRSELGIIVQEANQISEAVQVTNDSTDITKKSLTQIMTDLEEFQL